MILNQNDTARLQAVTEARKHGIYNTRCVYHRNWRSEHWLGGGGGGGNLDILFSCNMHTDFSDRNSDPRLCAVSIANNGIGDELFPVLIPCYTVSELTLLHSERPKLYTILAFLSATGLI